MPTSRTSGKLLDVEKVRIERRHEAAVFVAEDDDEAVDAVGGQGVEVALPVSRREAALEVSALHGVHGDAASGEIRSFSVVSRTYQGVGGIGPGDTVGDVESRIHESSGIGAAEDQRGLPAIDMRRMASASGSFGSGWPEERRAPAAAVPELSPS